MYFKKIHLKIFKKLKICIFSFFITHPLPFLKINFLANNLENCIITCRDYIFHFFLRIAQSCLFNIFPIWKKKIIFNWILIKNINVKKELIKCGLCNSLLCILNFIFSNKICLNLWNYGYFIYKPIFSAVHIQYFLLFLFLVFYVFLFWCIRFFGLF